MCRGQGSSIRAVDEGDQRQVASESHAQAALAGRFPCMLDALLNLCNDSEGVLLSSF